MEGRVYLCTWTKIDDRFRLWVKGRPHIAAESTSFEEAEERLCEAICKILGDGEAGTEFDPPRPQDPATAWYRRAAVVMVSGQSTAEIETLEPYFLGGLCPECQNPRGPRNDAPLVVDSIEAGYDGAVAKVLFQLSPGARSTVAPRLFSEDFIALLRPDETLRLTGRRVERRQRRARKVFHELLSSEVSLPEVGVKDVPVRGGWRCRTCNWTRLGFYGFVDGPFLWMSSETLPRPLPSCFTIGDSFDFQLCFTQARWRELVGKPGTKGIRSYEVGVVDADRVTSPRDLPFLDEPTRA